MSLASDNPYRAPRSPEADGGRADLRLRGLHAAWVGVFGANMVVPLLFATVICGESGWAGVIGAATLLLAAGGYACAASWKLGLTLVLGGGLVALSQLFPVAQIVAGAIGLRVGRVLGQVGPANDHLPGDVSSELGGFVVTMVAGGLLMAGAMAAGMVARAFTPEWWWAERGEGGTALARGTDLD